MKILIKNGLLIDKQNMLNKIADILIEDNRIIEISDYLDYSVDQYIDAKNCIVVPGLIDHHTHLYPFIKKGIPAESVCFSSGVTTAVDAGSLGCENFEDAINFLDYTRLGIKLYLNVSSLGLSTLPNLEDLNPKNFNFKKIQKLFKKYPEELIGLKVRMSKDIVGELGYEVLKEIKKIARKISQPLMVHSTDPPGPIKNMLNLLEKGDILTHMYQKSPFTIINQNSVDSSVYEARKRGIIFEAADARAHFSFEIAKKAIKEKYFPDIIATDLTAFSMYQRPTAFNMLMQISKYENLGMEFSEVIKCCTTNPAKLLGLRNEIGALKVGYKADIAILKKIYCDMEFGDRPYNYLEKNILKGKFVYNSMMTIKNGEIVYRDILF